VLFFSVVVIELDRDLFDADCITVGGGGGMNFFIDELFTEGIERLETTVVSFFVFAAIGVGIFDFLVEVCCRFNEVVVRMGNFDTF
jgi:hypothetical protein